MMRGRIRDDAAAENDAAGSEGKAVRYRRWPTKSGRSEAAMPVIMLQLARWAARGSAARARRSRR